jgi:hypothetical protein
MLLREHRQGGGEILRPLFFLRSCGLANRGPPGIVSVSTCKENKLRTFLRDMDKSLSRTLTQFVRSAEFGDPSWHQSTLALKQSGKTHFSAVL